MQKILVGLDTSPRAALVLETAADLAGRYGARLILVHAVGIPVDFPAAALGLSPTALPGVLEDAARQDLETKSRALPPGLAREVRVQIGNPWQVVCEIAKEQDCDLVIVGSHGYSGIDRLLGTTAARIVNHADRPVLVVRPKSAASASHPSH